MMEIFERGYVNFQMFFGNEGWEPEVSHIKKKFKEWHDCQMKKGWCGLNIAQQEGDKIYCSNLTGANRMTLRREGIASSDRDEKAKWTKDWQTKETWNSHASPEQQECVGTHELP